MTASVFYGMRKGEMLRLKKARQEAYGLTTRDIVFDGIRERPGYSEPWILSGNGCFRLGDFERVKGTP